MKEADRPPRRARPLRDDERKLWSTVARSVRPLKTGKPVVLPAPEGLDPPAPPKDTQADTPVAPAPPPKAKKTGPPPLAPLGRRVRQRIGRGSEPIERRLDLHGLTQAEAHLALAHFLRAAQAGGAKIVLVITGKGVRGDHGLFTERGVLRRLVPQWLKAPELRGLIVGFESASAGHGGEGALYVRLRRKRT